MNFLPKIYKTNQNPTTRGELDSNTLAWLNEFNYQPRQNLNSSINSETNGSTSHTENQQNNYNQPTAKNDTLNNSFSSFSTFSNLSQSATDLNETVYLALTNGCGHAKYEVGLAAFDMNCSRLILNQISDCFQFKQTIAKINLYSPTKIIIPNTLYNAFPVPQIISFIEKYFSGRIQLIPFDRSYFCNTNGCMVLKQLGTTKSQDTTLQLFKKYYAITAAAAIIKYLQIELKISFYEYSLNISYETCNNLMVIDLQTAHRLELLYSIDPTLNIKQKPSCLFEYLDNCITGIGKRTLRARILQPTYDLILITNRLNGIDELNKKTETMFCLNEILKYFCSIDRCAQIAYNIKQEENLKMSEGLINQVIKLKTFLDKLPELMNALSNLNTTFFVDIKELLFGSNFSFISNQINKIINCDLQLDGENQFFQRLHVIRPNIHSMLDFHHQIYSNALNATRQYIIKLSDGHKLPYRMVHSITRGFHIQLQLKEFRSDNQIPMEMEVLFRGKSTILLSNIQIKQFNYQINGVIKEITLLTYTIIANLIGNLRKEMDSIYNLMEIISELDIIISLAKVSQSGKFCCPTFSDEMRIIDGIHPFLYGEKSNKNPVPNRIIATPEFNFFIITGPNMSGKTVYLKTIAILQIIAQIGAFIPATNAQFRLCDKLFSRLGFNDDIEQNYSSFWLEMHDMKYILNNVTPNSLVVIDECCRSTNPEEGLIIAKKICEKLISIAGLKLTTVPNEQIDSFSTLNNITAPFIYFVTHFMELTKLQENHLNVINLRLTATENYDSKGTLHLTYPHTIAEGPSTIIGYGIALARTIRFPHKIIDIAEQLIKMQHCNITTANSSSKSSIIISNTINRHFSNSTIQISENSTATNNYNDLILNLYNLYSNIMKDIRINLNFKSLNPNQIQKIIQERLKENCLSENMLMIMRNKEKFHQIINDSKWFEKCNFNQPKNIVINDNQSNTVHEQFNYNINSATVTQTESLDETLSESSSFFDVLDDCISNLPIMNPTFSSNSIKRSDSFIGMKNNFDKDRSMCRYNEQQKQQQRHHQHQQQQQQQQQRLRQQQQPLHPILITDECSFVSTANTAKTADSLLNYITENRDDLSSELSSSSSTLNATNYERVDESMDTWESNNNDNKIDPNLLLTPPDQFK